jgi:protease-4
MSIKLPSAADAGPMVASVIRPARGSGAAARLAVIDVDGVLLNQNREGVYDSGENPVAAFREKLEASANDARVVAIVLRINSPGGGVTACDIMAAELGRFRSSTRKPVVACLMDVATSGAYYLALGADRIVAHPTSLTGGIGVIFNHVNLQDAMAQLNVTEDPVKAGALIDMGSVTKPLEPRSRQLLQEVAESFRQRFMDRVTQRRPGLTEAGRKAIADGRVMAAPEALRLHLVDRLGYIDDALLEAEHLAGISDAEVLLYHRTGSPARSVYEIAPGPARLSEVIPFSYPGLDRAKLPTFLYLWQPDPTLTRTSAR